MSGPAAGTQIDIADEFQIGRAAPEEGRLGDDPELSRAHAKVTRNAQGQLVIEDLGSTNGTAVNGQRIGGPTPLKAGDTVQVGKTTLQLQDEGGLQATALGAAAGGGAAGAAAAAPPPPPAPPTAPTAPVAAGGPQSPGTPPPPPPPPGGGGPAFGGGPGSGGLGGPPPGGAQPAGSPGGGGKKGLFIGLGAAALAAVVVVLVLVLAGGGSDSNDEDDVRAAVTSFFDNDCDVLTDDYREELFGDGEGTPQEACEEAADEATEETDFEVGDVEVNGDDAEAEVEVESEDATFELTREGDDWKVEGIDADIAMAGGGATESTPTETVPTETQTEDPRRTEAIATLQALITAVQDNDEEVFCGLLSPRQAQRLVGGAGGDAAIARCVEVAADVDLSENVPDAIDVTGVRITGNQASVRLTTGERFTLIRRNGRYVINSGLG